MDQSYTATEIIQLQDLQNNVAAIAKSRIPTPLARLHESRYVNDVLRFRPYAARNSLFARFETLVEGLIETKLLLSDQLCSICSLYNWAIIPGADDLRESAVHDKHSRHARSIPTKRSEDVLASVNPVDPEPEPVWLAGLRSEEVLAIDDSSEPEPEPVWLAKSLPSGSLFELLTRPGCRICMLVLHLISPLPIKSLLSWSLDQPLSILQGFRYSMEYTSGEAVLVKTKQPPCDLWQDAGSIETIREDNREKHEADEQSLVWASSKLSKRRLLNSSWVHTTGIDYSLVKYWLRRCNEHHHHCHISRSHGRKDVDIRLIDVVDYCIVPGTLSHRYFALSYVWGGVQRLRATKENIAALEQKNALRVRSASLPRTVQDAMTFVASLEQRYLWVDSLCIVQDDSTEKHGQISNMHKIYSAAYATIVQHSGCDANAGLPGVRPGSRSLLATRTHVGTAIIMAKANHATPKVLTSSVHSSRGWTHQEVVLSNRCLHFFNKHLTYVCEEEWAQDWNTQYKDKDRSTKFTHTEPTQVPSHMLWRMNPFWFARTSSGPMWTPSTLAWLQYFEIYGRIVVEFTGRQLSFETDVLSAFYGLAGAITRLNRATFYFGIPSNSIDLALLWINLGPGSRRGDKDGRQTPSWSWAGWTGRSTYNLLELSENPSPPYTVNSYVRQFYIVDQGQSVEIKRDALNHSKATPYYEARERCSEPAGNPAKASSWPDGCLHFWAEECPMSQMYFAPSDSTNLRSIAFLYHGASNHCCGIFALPSNFKTLEATSPLSGPSFSLILMSESRTVLPHWTFGPDGTHTKSRMAPYGDISLSNFPYEPIYHDGQQYREAWMFNVLLVKRSGLFVERIAFGQVHMLAWLDLRRSRRYIRMI